MKCQGNRWAILAYELRTEKDKYGNLKTTYSRRIL